MLYKKISSSSSVGSLSKRDIWRFDLMFFNDRSFAFLWALVGDSEVRGDAPEGVVFNGRPGERF